MFYVWKVQRNAAFAIRAFLSEAAARNFGLRVPGFCAVGKECVFFVSGEFGWSECATGEPICLPRLTFVEEKMRSLRCVLADVRPCWSC